MTFLYAVLVLSLVALLGSAVLAWARVRRELKASDETLRRALAEIQAEQEVTRT
ncbi:MAG TPA: hypothetical protein VLE48_11240 [Terriglobales bacterium]|nr:hypothetical protein [Terriglobales bacterium]